MNKAETSQTCFFFFFFFAQGYILRNGKTVIGTPWEMVISGDLLIRKKQGDVYGYNSLIILLPEMKLGKYSYSACIANSNSKALIICQGGFGGSLTSSMSTLFLKFQEYFKNEPEAEILKRM